MYGMSIFWNLIQDDSTLSRDLVNFAYYHLVNVLGVGPHSHKFKLLELCIENVKNHVSVPVSLQLTTKIYGNEKIEKRKKEKKKKNTSSQ